MNLGTAPRQYDAASEAKLRADLERILATCVQRGVSITYLLMSKPDGTVGKLTINAGGTPIWTAL
jgi:hypothetical protein